MNVTTSITDRLEKRWAESIGADYAARGSSQQVLPPGHVRAWRATARRVARELGRPVQTVARSLPDGSHLVHARLTDWPADAGEAVKQQAAMRRAAGAAASARPEPRSVD